MSAPASSTSPSTKHSSAKAVGVFILLQALGLAAAWGLVCSEALAPWGSSGAGAGAALHFLAGS